MDVESESCPFNAIQCDSMVRHSCSKLVVYYVDMSTELAVAALCGVSGVVPSPQGIANLGYATRESHYYCSRSQATPRLSTLGHEPTASAFDKKGRPPAKPLATTPFLHSDGLATLSSYLGAHQSPSAHRPAKHIVPKGLQFLRIGTGDPKLFVYLHGSQRAHHHALVCPHAQSPH